MFAVRLRLGALVAMASLILTPAARLACLVLCVAPSAVQAPAAPHAHHHPQADAAPSSTAAARAAAGSAAETRCEAAPGSACADTLGVAPRPAPRVAGDSAIAQPRPWLADAAVVWRPHPSPPPIRAAPPGPPPAPTPLRV